VFTRISKATGQLQTGFLKPFEYCSQLFESRPVISDFHAVLEKPKGTIGDDLKKVGCSS
jgi:hypothetical protein